MFNHDILLLDIEATGLDVTRHEMIQLAAILLDKKTLREKKSFTTYIKPRKWKNREEEAMAVNGIKWENLKNAPSLTTALRKFNRAFPKDSIPTNYGGNMDVVFMSAAYRDTKVKYPFDYHTFNMWALCYTYMALNKQLNSRLKFPGFGLDDIARHFKIKIPDSRHDALADCRLEADVLRKVVKSFAKK